MMIIRNILVLLAMVSCCIPFFGKQLNPRLLWAAFFSTLWNLVTLLIVNAACVKLRLWEFSQEEYLIFEIPPDILFIWVVLWGFLPTIFTKGKKLLTIALIAGWVDIILMPQMEVGGIIQLAPNWWLGEIALVLLVFVPGQIWAKHYWEEKRIWLRSLFQFVTMMLIYVIGIPNVLFLYLDNLPHGVHPDQRWWSMQLLIWICVPAIIALKDLNKKGRGTPFPFDATDRLVTSGVYAYVRNPIQWSLTFCFIPLAMFHDTFYLLTGIPVSIAYTIGISNGHEGQDMKERFGSQWEKYKKGVKAWFFKFRPVDYPSATIYFKRDCNYCAELRRWVENRNPHNLRFEHAEDFQGRQLTQVTYVDEFGNEYGSVRALAEAVQHINVFWAWSAWIVKLPGIVHLLQLIIDSMELGQDGQCEVKGD